MKAVHVLAALALLVILSVVPAAAAGSPSLVTADLPATDSLAVPAAQATTFDAACSVPKPELFSEAGFETAAAYSFSGCFQCTSSSQCQPICGGQVGQDFVCHYEPSCGSRRYCLCF
jgi:hypothetical protein